MWAWRPVGMRVSAHRKPEALPRALKRKLARRRLELIVAVVISTLGGRDWGWPVAVGVVGVGLVVVGFDGGAAGATVIGVLIAASVTNSGTG